MAKYLLIESRDPFESKDVENYYRLAVDLVRDGNQVTLFLVQNGVSATRPNSLSGRISDAVQAGVEVLADDFSLRERGIESEHLVDGVTAAPLDIIIDQLAEGRKALWH